MGKSYSEELRDYSHYISDHRISSAYHHLANLAEKVERLESNPAIRFLQWVSKFRVVVYRVQQ